MSRVWLAALFAGATALAGAARAELPVAPPPRPVAPDGSRPPVPRPDPGESPAVTVERIIKNSKAVGDRLEQKDTGTDTRQTQGRILADIDALLNRQEPPPPDKDKNKDKDKEQDKKDQSDQKDDKKDSKDDKKDDPKDKKDSKDDKKDNPDKKDSKDKKEPKDKGDGKGDPKEQPNPKDQGMPMGKNDMNPAPMPKPKDDMMGNAPGEPPMGRRPRMNEPMDDDKKEPESGKEPKSDDKKEPKDAKEPKQPGGKASGVPMGKGGGVPALPDEDDGSKDVWGHLPDKLRKQMSQYYQADFAPKYAEMLKLYYSSLADKGGRPPEPKK